MPKRCAKQHVHTWPHCPSQNVIDTTRHRFQKVTISWIKSQTTAPPICTTTRACDVRLVVHSKTFEIVSTNTNSIQPTSYSTSLYNSLAMSLMLCQFFTIFRQRNIFHICALWGRDFHDWVPATVL